MEERRKKTQLPRDNYVGPRWYFVTICCHRRHPFFSNMARATSLVELLRKVSEKHKFSVHAYCVMPDHFHALVEGKQMDSNLVSFLRILKSESAFLEKKKSGRQLWQRYFHDHILRKAQEADPIAWYIWMNPVRRGLCRIPQEYPFSGSLTVDWKARSKPIEDWVPHWKKGRSEDAPLQSPHAGGTGGSQP